IIAVQTDYQSDLIKHHHQKDTVQVDMAVELPAPSVRTTRDIDVLWVNNIRPFKRPDLALEMARRLPALHFVMIGGPVDEHAGLFRTIAAQASAIPNLEFLGFVPYTEVNAYYSRAKVFMNTSDTE